MLPRRPHIVRDERGYLMVALLVAMSVMAILMGAALPAWRTWAQREKEAELIFRGEQYARAIALYQQRFANASPPDIDTLVTQRYLRKKYKDPMTGGDFQLVTAGAIPGEGQPPTPESRTPAARGRGAGQPPLGQQAAPGQFGSVGGAGRGGIVGVVSKSTEKSFRRYNGRDTYNQWVFLGVQQSVRAGGPGGAAGRGGQDGRGGGRDGRGGSQQPPGRGIQQPPGRGLQQPPGRGDQPQPGPRGGFGGRGF